MYLKIINLCFFIMHFSHEDTYLEIHKFLELRFSSPVSPLLQKIINSLDIILRVQISIKEYHVSISSQQRNSSATKWHVDL